MFAQVDFFNMKILQIFQVDLEPHGQIHLELELRGSLSEGNIISV